MGKTTRTMLATITAAGLLTGCASGGDDGGGETTSSSSSAPVKEASPGDPGGSQLDEAAADAGIDPAAPPQPLASVTMPGAGSIGNTEPTDITLDLLSLRRDGDLLVLNLAFTPDKGKPTNYYGWTGTGWAPQVIDTTNLKVHDVVETASGPVSTGTGPAGTSVGGGQTLYLYAVFAAPPQDVKTVTVKPADGAPAFTGVTIQ